VAQKERWRAAGGAAGFNQGGTLSTAGNLVFAVATAPFQGSQQHLLAYRADTGERVGDIQTCMTSLGPPMTFQLDGKQYLAISGATMLTGGGGGGVVDAAGALRQDRR
jgi:glucose dehydrogenase